MINNPTAPSTSRQPRAIITVNGEVASGLVSLEVDNNSFYQADTFIVHLALSAQPPVHNWAWWASQTQIQIGVYAGFPKNVDAFTIADLSLLILGTVDDIGIDPVADAITLSGRDLTSSLIDNQTYDKWPQQTSSQIATTLALRRGLTPVVTKTTTPSGRFYTTEHALETRRMTEWDLLTYLAKQEDFSVFVRGTSLFFQPRAQPTDEPYLIRWQLPLPKTAPSSEIAQAGPISNVVHVHFKRSLTIARDVIVSVRSFDLKTGSAFTIQRSAIHPQRTPGLPAQKYFRYIPGLTRQQALNRAQELLHEITQHEMLMFADMPADNTLTPQNVIQVQGTGTMSDQIYYPARIHRRWSFHEGYRMSVDAKNHAVESETFT